MNMKSIVCLFFFFTVLGCGRAQDPFLSPYPPRHWQVTLRVVDETGQPVGKAQTAVSYMLPTPPDEETRSGRVSGQTDTNGIFVAMHVDGASALGFHIEKSGYYPTFARYELEYPPKKEATNIPMQTLVLKEIRNPIPMYVKRIGKGPPVFNEPVGYDLMAGDWIEPHGKGQAADMIFTGDLNRRALEDFDYTLTVNFPNPGDGIQEFEVVPTPSLGEGSALRSPHEAPADGYQQKVVRLMSRHPGQGTKDDSDKNRNYFFRVRTVLDEKGTVKSALYGKIYGDFMQFRYYLNPTPNDRNVEFDPKRNLLKGLKSTEQVDAP